MQRLMLLVLAVFFCNTAWCQAGDLRVCRSIEDPLDRVACYDQIVDAAVDAVAEAAAEDENVDTTAPIVASSPAAQPTPAVSPVEPAEAEVDPVTLFGRDESSIKEALEVEDIGEIVFAVSRVRKTAHGKLVIVLENGQVWVQADSNFLSLKPGSEVRIRAGLGGSYHLNKTSGSRSIKVRRAD